MLDIEIDELKQLALDTIEKMDDKPDSELDFQAGFVAGWMSNDENSGWRPIETAPKDGTQILVSDDETVDAAYWDYEDWCAPHSCANGLPYEPKAWMPLPKAPNG